MIASLTMYDRPETASANDRLWAGIRGELGFGPDQLTRGGNPWKDWQNPDLILSQTCGLPFRMGLHKTVHLVASPDHELDGCAPGMYRSALVARADDPRSTFAQFEGAKLAYNSTDSQSGWAAPMAHCVASGVTLQPGLKTGAHRASASAVASGKADIAALDAVSWIMMQRWDEFSNELKVIGWTSPTPALPFITARADLVGPLAGAIAAALTALSATDRQTLCLHATVRLPAERYLALPLPPGL